MFTKFARSLILNQKQKKIPLYIQIRNKIVSNIKDEIWGPGKSIPSESQLIEKYNVSRTTIRQAIRDLVQNGILETSRGAPTKVKKIPDERLSTPGVVQHEIGSDMSIVVLRMKKNDNKHYRAKSSLLLEKEDTLFFMERLRIADGKPIAIQKTYLPSKVGAVVETIAHEEFDFFPTLGKYNIYHIKINEEVTAKNATKEEADLLDIAAGDALLMIERVTLGIDLQPIEFSVTKYTPDAFKYLIELD